MSEQSPELHQAPGAPVYVGPEHGHAVQVRVMHYSPERLRQEELGPATAEQAGSTPEVTWVDVDGLHDVDTVTRIGRMFHLHPLAVEDILTVDTRAKAELYPDALLFNLKRLRVDDGVEGGIDDEHITLVLCRGVLVSFSERPGTPFRVVRRRIEGGVGRIRSRRADYLLHALLDSVVDEWIAQVDLLEQRVAELEARALDHFDEDLPTEVHQLRRRLNSMRRAVAPTRDAVNLLLSEAGDLISSQTEPYLRDLRDHIIEVTDGLDGLRDRLQATLDLHLALAGHRMNEIMRTFTVVTTVFIPLSFLTGLYGMNFDHMPELHTAWGYPALLGIMGVVSGGMLVWFRRRGWL